MKDSKAIKQLEETRQFIVDLDKVMKKIDKNPIDKKDSKTLFDWITNKQSCSTTKIKTHTYNVDTIMVDDFLKKKNQIAKLLRRDYELIKLKKQKILAYQKEQELLNKLKLEDIFVDALKTEIENTRVPLITRNAKRADIRIGSRLYEFKVLHNKGMRDSVKLEQLKNVHPDILESNTTIKWNLMFKKIKSYCEKNNTYTIKVSNNPELEQMRWWLSNQIKLINDYFKKYNLLTSISSKRHDEMIRRNSLLIDAGLKVDREIRLQRSSVEKLDDLSGLEKRSLIRQIDQLINLLKKSHGIDYFKVLRHRVEDREKQNINKLKDLRETKRMFKTYEVTEESNIDATETDKNWEDIFPDNS